MEEIINAMEQLKPSNAKTIEEIMLETINDPDIKRFLDEYDEIVTDEMLWDGLSAMREYIIRRNDEQYRPEMMLFNGHIQVNYVMRDQALALKYRDKVPSKLHYDDATAKYKGITLDVYETDMSNVKAFTYVEDFIENYTYGDNSKGMWLNGKMGVGKTYLMAGLATALHQRQVGVNFVSASQMMDDMYEQVRQNSNQLKKQLGYLQKSEVLILDDLGTENPTRWMLKNVLYPIVKYRGEYNKPTFITSNLTKDDYYKQLNEGREIIRMDIARLKEQLDVLMTEVPLGGQNRRQKA